jgi:hypothetical protein
MKKFMLWLCRILAAIIMAQTLYFKFTGAAESIYIFKTLGIEPVGRIVVGMVELLACILILWPKTNIMGTILTLAVMSGALFSHLTKLGIQVLNDDGKLFGLAVLVWFSSLLLLILQAKDTFKYLKSIYVWATKKLQ